MRQWVVKGWARWMGVWMAAWLVLPVQGEDGDDLREPVPMWASGPEHAADLMSEVRAAIPKGPMEIEATIRARRSDGRPERRLGAQMRMRSGRGGDTLASYTLRDALGRPTDELTVIRDADGATAYSYRVGDPPREEAVPPLAGAIHETDLTWLDLSLAYLWWPGGNTVGTDRLRGRFCYLIDLPVPPEIGAAAQTVRLWVDPALPMLLQAEASDADGTLRRRLAVESFRKMDDVWFVQDIEVTSHPARSRTTLRVDSVQEGLQPEGDDQAPESLPATAGMTGAM